MCDTVDGDCHKGLVLGEVHSPQCTSANCQHIQQLGCLHVCHATCDAQSERCRSCLLLHFSSTTVHFMRCGQWQLLFVLSFVQHGCHLLTHLLSATGADDLQSQLSRCRLLHRYFATCVMVTCSMAVSSAALGCAPSVAEPTKAYLLGKAGMALPVSELGKAGWTGLVMASHLWRKQT